MFDTRHWLATHVQEAAGIDEEAWHAVASLTLLWNLFEQRHCDKRGDIQHIETAVDKLAYGPQLPDGLAEALLFWINRYVENGTTNSLFMGLNFRPNDRREFVETVISGNASPRDQLLAMLIIVYRLRNNLFHGEKELSTLNEQRENLDVACRVLAMTMELLG